MTIIKWITKSYYETIEPFECNRETEHTIWYTPSRAQFDTKPPRERKAAKVSDYERYHDSWDAAHAYLIARAEDKLARARIQLQLTQGKLGNVRGMKKPQDALGPQP